MYSTVQQCLNKVWIPARTTQSGIRSLSTEPICVTWSASIDRDAVLMKGTKRPSVSQPDNIWQLMSRRCTTYGLSDGKVPTSIVDIVIIFDKIARADVPFVSQTIARLVRGGCVKRALGGVLSRAQRITG
jgi:hypothetical protein